MINEGDLGLSSEHVVALNGFTLSLFEAGVAPADFHALLQGFPIF